MSKITFQWAFNINTNLNEKIFPNDYGIKSDFFFVMPNEKILIPGVEEKIELDTRSLKSLTFFCDFTLKISDDIRLIPIDNTAETPDEVPFRNTSKFVENVLKTDYENKNVKKYLSDKVLYESFKFEDGITLFTNLFPQAIEIEIKELNQSKRIFHVVVPEYKTEEEHIFEQQESFEYQEIYRQIIDSDANVHRYLW